MNSSRSGSSEGGHKAREEHKNVRVDGRRCITVATLKRGKLQGNICFVCFCCDSQRQRVAIYKNTSLQLSAVVMSN